IASAKEQDSYFNTLERKEQVEAKLATITERKVRVADCAQCGVRCQQPSERCKTRGTPAELDYCGEEAVQVQGLQADDVHLGLPLSNASRAAVAAGRATRRPASLPSARGPTLERDVLLARGEERKFV
uniref:Mcm10 domain-containing protein n=1 Tax=Macrostomum lignano TaxID=282301 RepID=A0A1I8FBH6_9PLAT